MRDQQQVDETRAEAFELIRSLVEEIRLLPVDGELRIELRGDLARTFYYST
jgi:hypothetical protein